MRKVQVHLRCFSSNAHVYVAQALSMASGIVGSKKVVEADVMFVEEVAALESRRGVHSYIVLAGHGSVQTPLMQIIHLSGSI